MTYTIVLTKWVVSLWNSLSNKKPHNLHQVEYYNMNMDVYSISSE